MTGGGGIGKTRGISNRQVGCQGLQCERGADASQKFEFNP